MFDLFRYAFEWDQRKDMINRRKHKVSFNEARTVFFDEMAVVEYDREEDGEDRYVIMGASHKGRVLRVVFTFRGHDGNLIRIITARKVSNGSKQA